MIHESSVKLAIDSKIVHVSLLAKAVRGMCGMVIFDEQLLYNLELCMVEAVTNVINHAYKRKPDHVVEVIINLTPHEIIFKIIDEGEHPLIPTIKKELDYNPNDVRSLPESGMGLFLIHKLMDQVSYTSEANKNILIMKKSYTMR